MALADAERTACTREELKPYVGRRITVEGRLHKYGSFEDTKLNRNVPTALMQDLDIMEGTNLDKRFALVSYLWLQFASPMKEAGAQPGDVVRFSAIAFSYRTRDDLDLHKWLTKYSLKDPVSVEIVRPLSDGYFEPSRNGMIGVNVAPNTPIPQLVSIAKREEVPPAPESKRPDARACFDTIFAAVQEFGLVKVEKALGAVKLMQE